MERIYTSHFQRIDFEPDSSLMKILWLNTEKLRNEIYKKELLEQINLIECFKPQQICIDTSTFAFVISPEVQEWNNTTILKRVIEVGVKYVALLISHDLFAQVSIEQNMDEETTGSFTTRFFETELDALMWLNKHNFKL